jgi:hypothetical protein
MSFKDKIAYLKEGVGVINEMFAGLITAEEAGAQITQLRRKYGLKDRP